VRSKKPDTASGPEAMATNDSLFRAVLLVALALLLFPVLMMAVMMPMMGGFGWSQMSGHGMWNGNGFWITMLVLILVPLLILIGLGYAVSRILTGSAERTDDALEELRLAYARGDLSDEEFEKRRDRLQREE
jgi:putative membrane protein